MNDSQTYSLWVALSVRYNAIWLPILGSLSFTKEQCHRKFDRQTSCMNDKIKAGIVKISPCTIQILEETKNE